MIQQIKRLDLQQQKYGDMIMFKGLRQKISEYISVKTKESINSLLSVSK